MGRLAEHFEKQAEETQAISEHPPHAVEMFGLQKTEAKYRLVLQLQDLREELAGLETKQKTYHILPSLAFSSPLLPFLATIPLPLRHYSDQTV
jgi:hypothetical protein